MTDQTKVVEKCKVEGNEFMFIADTNLTSVVLTNLVFQISQYLKKHFAQVKFYFAKLNKKIMNK